MEWNGDGDWGKVLDMHARSLLRVLYCMLVEFELVCIRTFVFQLLNQMQILNDTDIIINYNHVNSIHCEHLHPKVGRRYLASDDGRRYLASAPAVVCGNIVPSTMGYCSRSRIAGEQIKRARRASDPICDLNYGNSIPSLMGYCSRIV